MALAEAPASHRNTTPEGPRPVEPIRVTAAVRFVRASIEDDRTTPELPWHLADLMSSVDRLGFMDILCQIADLAGGDETDEYGILRPSGYALRTTFDLFLGTLMASLEQAVRHDKKRRFPRGCVTTDEQGGLRIEWADEDRAVHLVVPAAQGGRSYIYHELGEAYGTEDRVSGSVLACWLQRLFG